MWSSFVGCAVLLLTHVAGDVAPSGDYWWMAADSPLQRAAHQRRDVINVALNPFINKGLQASYSDSSGARLIPRRDVRQVAFAAPAYLPPIETNAIAQPARAPPPPSRRPIYVQDELSGESINVQQVLRRRPPANERAGVARACAAALKCVAADLCSPAGVISSVPMVLTPQQELARVPVTDCHDRQSGVTGKCCRDPYYQDPWPSANLVNGIDNGAYREDPSLGQYKRSSN